MLVVFDLDGTLIDSRRDLADAANALIVERGGDPLSVDAITAMVGEGAATLVRRALTAAHIHEGHIDGALERFLQLYDDRLLAHTHLYEGIDGVLRDLSDCAALAVLTNKPLGATRRILEGLGILRAFRWVLGGDGPHPRKPDPEGLLHIVANAGVAREDTIMVGDSGIDLATAHAAGCVMCLARYGFGYREGLLVRGDELVVDKPADLRTLVSARR